MSDSLSKKAELVLGGDVRLPEGFVLPCRISRSTAGPGAGLGSAVFSFDGLRVKKTVSYDEGEFELNSENGRMSLLRNGRIFLDDVTIQPVVRHSPEQAFFNLDSHCIYSCRFCNSPLLKKGEDKKVSTDDIMRMLDESFAKYEVKAVSFTSAVADSVQSTVDRMADAVKAVRARYPDVPIGVEPYVNDVEQLLQLKRAGADEIKLNIQAAREDILQKVCPDLVFDNIMRMLEEACRIFSKGKVLSNVIFGLGESDEDMISMMERLCSMGVMPDVRAVRINGSNRARLMEAGVSEGGTSVERMMGLAKSQKSIMQRYGLDASSSRTMCFACRCCDIVPFLDM